MTHDGRRSEHEARPRVLREEFIVCLIQTDVIESNRTIVRTGAEKAALTHSRALRIVRVTNRQTYGLIAVELVVRVSERGRVLEKVRDDLLAVLPLHVHIE